MLNKSMKRGRPLASQQLRPLVTALPRSPGKMQTNSPKIHELEFWKSQVTSNIVAASGDLDHEAWIAWIAPTLHISPGIDGVLANSGDTIGSIR